MQDSVLLSKQTFEELVKQMENYVKLLEVTIRREEKHKESIMSHMYDPTYIEALAQEKVHALQVVDQGKAEAMLVSSQKVKV